MNLPRGTRSLTLISLLGILMIAVLLLLFLQYDWESAKNDDAKYSGGSVVLENGEIVFTQYCASCHGIQDDGFGPRLGGITSLIPQNKLRDLIKNAPLVVASGDSRTNILKAKYKLLMPSFEFLREDEISDVLSYIHHQSEILQIDPLHVSVESIPIAQRLIPSVKRSGLVIELEDYVQIPRSPQRPSDKGVATIRSHPSIKRTLFVSDQMGILYKVHDSAVDTFLDIKLQLENFIYEPGIGTGLGSFVFHPGFLENGLFYTSHAENYTGKVGLNDGDFPDSVGIALQWVLSEWKLMDILSDRFVGKYREVLRINTPTTAHGMQDIGFAPADKKGDFDYGMLYVSIGDGGSINIKMPELVHHIRSILGTLLRIDPMGKNSASGNYGIPRDNPFAKSTDHRVKKEIWAYGFRNPHRMCWDMAFENRMLVADIGETNIEEVNLIDKGGDYGWSSLEGNFGISIKTNPKVVHEVAASELINYNGPFGQYDHQDGSAISGGFVYMGPIVELRHKYVFGDIVTGRLFYMNMDKILSDSTVYEIAIVQDGKRRFFKEIAKSNRVHLRIGYDRYTGDLFFSTKGDGMIRRITKAYYEANEIQ